MIVDEWEGCYEGGWKNWIVPEAFSHPAKFSRALIERIYDHAMSEGWIEEGSIILDPFAGVALGGLNAMSMGLNWVGVELEPKFVDTATGFDCDGIVESHEELKHFEFVPGGWYVRLRLEAAYWGKSLKKMYGGWGESEGFDTEEVAIEAKKKVLKQEGTDRYNEDAYTVIYEELEIEVDKLVMVIDKPARCGGRKTHAPHHVLGNFELWQRELAGWPNLGTATIIQGDSRKLKDVIEKADLVISSPPFMEVTSDHPSKNIIRSGLKMGKSSMGDGYGHTPGNLANLKEGNFDMICGSPPYADKLQNAGGGRLPVEFNCGNKNMIDDCYGQSPGQLGSMKEGSIDAVISSPPYSQEGLGHRGRPSEIDIKKALYGRINNAEYGQTSGQLGSMKEGGFDAVVSSPPFELCDNAKRHSDEYRKKFMEQKDAKWGKGRSKNRFDLDQLVKVDTAGQLGRTSGDTFWSASKIIVQQCYDILKPQGHAIWITKNYVKNKQIVPFTDRWLALCESVGFKLVCHHHAMLVGLKFEKDHVKIVERKSFFRRLAESKGSPRIDWEDVICFVK